MSNPEIFEQIVEQVAKNTSHLYPLWMGNFPSNLATARAGDSLDKIYARPPVSRAMIAGRGPSLMKYGHPSFLKEHRFPGAVVASDGALPLLLDAGVFPAYSLTVDGSPIIAKWYQGRRVRKAATRTEVIMPVTAHPDTVKACTSKGFHIYWYIPELDQGEEVRGLTKMLQLQSISPQNTTGLSRMNGAGAAGLCSIVFALTILRAREIVLVGMDNGYPPDTPLEELHYHTKILERCGYDPQQASKFYSILWVPAWQQYCVVDPVFEVYRRTYENLSSLAAEAGVKIYNCTEGGCLTKNATCLPLKAYFDGLIGT